MILGLTWVCDATPELWAVSQSKWVMAVMNKAVIRICAIVQITEAQPMQERRRLANAHSFWGLNKHASKRTIPKVKATPIMQLATAASWCQCVLSEASGARLVLATADARMTPLITVRAARTRRVIQM